MKSPWIVEAVICAKAGDKLAARDLFMAHCEVRANFHNSVQLVDRFLGYASHLVDLPATWPPANWAPRETLDLYSRLMERRPASARLYWRRGSAYARLGLFDMARADYEQAVKLNPGGCIGGCIPCRLALGATYLFLNNRESYKRLCRDSFDQHCANPSWAVKRELALLCCFSPDSQVDLKQLDDLATAACAKENSKTATSVRGMIAYRQGNWNKTIDILRGIKTQVLYRELSLLFEAMAYQQLGKTQTARETLRKADAYINKITLDGPPTPWYETPMIWCALQVVRREAAEVIGPLPEGVEDSAE